MMYQIYPNISNISSKYLLCKDIQSISLSVIIYTKYILVYNYLLCNDIQSTSCHYLLCNNKPSTSFKVLKIFKVRN